MKTMNESRDDKNLEGDSNKLDGSMIASSPGRHESNQFRYYASCFVAGGLCSSIRWAMTPLDLAKIRMQVYTSSSLNSAQTMIASSVPNNNNGLLGTLRSIYRNEGGLVALFRGLTPTIMAASVQTSCKYGLYEIFKDKMIVTLSRVSGDTEEIVRQKYKSYIFITSAACAEAVADIIMCPWEMLKVQVQTTRTSITSSSFMERNNFMNQSSKRLLPTQTLPAFAQMLRHRREYNNFPLGSIGPLWARQVPGTIINFLTFETVAHIIYHQILSGDKEEYTKQQQLLVSLCAGHIAGVGNAVLSHPADSILSHMALREYQGKNAYEVISKVGWHKLATKGLGTRILITGNVIGTQWLLYDSIKCLLGFGTTGGDGGRR